MRLQPLPAQPSPGFTLVEILVASALTLTLMAALSAVFSFVSSGVTESRASVEMNGHIRNCKHRLQQDLSLLTAPTIPPLSPSAENGYLEIIEGPVGPIFRPDDLELAANRDRVEFGDMDDILMFTALAPADEPFVGRWNGSAVATSQVAEIAWFLRGTTLYRRVLLVLPNSIQPWQFQYDRTKGNFSASYNNFDLSMRQEDGVLDRRALPPATSRVRNDIPRIVPNSLGELTNRKNRYAHQPLAWPYESRFWGRVANSIMPGLGLPTLAECCHRQWPFPLFEPVQGYPGASTFVEVGQVGVDPRALLIVPSVRATNSAPGFSSLANGALLLSANGRYDPLGTNPTPFSKSNPVRKPNSRPVGQIDSLNRLNNFRGSRFDDVIMTNVMAFDVKVWDPGAPRFENTAGPDVVPLIPGDWGYIDAVKQFIRNGSTTTAALVGFGAYADLNYMQPTGYDPYDPARLRIVPPAAPPSSNAAIPPPPAYPANVGYESALRRFEAVNRWPKGSLPRPKFSGAGDSGCAIHGVPATTALASKPLACATPLAAVYDTWSSDYERDGIDNDLDGLVDEGTDGVDNPPYRFGIDDPSEVDAPPPYPWALRGIQIKIRAFEPNTKQIREMTVVAEFLPE